MGARNASGMPLPESIIYTVAEIIFQISLLVFLDSHNAARGDLGPSFMYRTCVEHARGVASFLLSGCACIPAIRTVVHFRILCCETASARFLLPGIGLDQRSAFYSGWLPLLLGPAPSACPQRSTGEGWLRGVSLRGKAHDRRCACMSIRPHGPCVYRPAPLCRRILFIRNLPFNISSEEVYGKQAHMR